MASTATRQALRDDYFSFEKRKPPNSIAAYSWGAHAGHRSGCSSDSRCSHLPSPISPQPRTLPAATCQAPSAACFAGVKSEATGGDLGPFADWMSWDEPTVAALSPTSSLCPPCPAEPASPNMAGLAFPGPGYGPGSAEFMMDDGPAVLLEGSMSSDASLFHPPLAPHDTLRHADLHSPALSWVRPSPARPRLAGCHGRRGRGDARPFPSMGMGLPSAPDPCPTSPHSSPSPPDHGAKLKRKSSVEEEEEDDAASPEPATQGAHPPMKKTAHNMIEKRYRTNLNDKIAALRDAVPSLRMVSKKTSRGEVTPEDLQGLTPAHKLNKATVLSKATEYISHLEKRNSYLAKENAALTSRVDAFEILVMSRPPSHASLGMPPPPPQPPKSALPTRSQMSMSRQQYIMGGFNTPM